MGEEKVCRRKCSTEEVHLLRSLLLFLWSPREVAHLLNKNADLLLGVSLLQRKTDVEKKLTLAN